MVSDAVLGWAAGIIDGEGHIQIGKSDPRIKNGEVNPVYNARVTVESTNPDMANELHRNFGGTVYVRRNTNKKWRNTKSWVIRAQKAEEFIQCIRPYLVCKAEEADIFLQFRQTYGERSGAKTIDNVVQLRENFYVLLKKLHKQDHVF